MDHLLLPDGVEPFIVVPYNAKKNEFYDHKGFMGYPERNGWSEQDLLGENNFGGRSDDEVETFFQTWLFFAFGIEILKAAGIAVTTEDFLFPEAEQSNRVVTTRELPSWLMKWKQLWPSPENISSECTCKNPHSINLTGNLCEAKPCWKDFNYRDSSASQNTQKVLTRACVYFDRYCNNYNRRFSGHKELYPWPVREEISLSMIALGFTLRQAAIQIYDIPLANYEWGAATSSLLKRCLSEKWCKSDAAMMIDDLQIDGLYYLAASASPPKEYINAHDKCSEDTCVAKVSEKTYVTRHAASCEKEMEKFTGVEEQAPSDFLDTVLEIIERDGTPIVFWDKKDRKIIIKEYNPKQHKELKYVAISHVWADGMGNPHKNLLPECQLTRIQSMVDDLDFPGRELSDCSCVGFWMDTLCVPVDPKHKSYRHSCIRNMRHIYSAASAVLVLDSWLQEIPHTAPLPDRYLRIYQSNWLRRLWTYQEGSLAQELYYRWSDKAQHQNTLEDECEKFNEDLPARGIYLSFPNQVGVKFTIQFTILKGSVERFVNSHAPDEDRWPLFLPLVDAFAHRQTTRASDETLCLSTVLGMDPQPYLDIRGDDAAERRMETFLTAIKTFDAGIIFSSYQRLTKVGFRWAPRSLLGYRTSNIGSISDGRRGTVQHIGNQIGLFVRYYGLRCKLAHAARRFLPASERVCTILIKNDDSNTFYYSVELQLVEDVQWNPHTMYGLVMTFKPGGEAGSLAMLGSEILLPEGEEPRDIHALRWECNAIVRRREGEATESDIELISVEETTKWMIC